ncbi:MAG: 23S rRNA (uracil(1939)-C(5))-methyltransferase RlmD [Alicyclobacillus herbarius]|uniref:23S rRNA (uracil(1939)-C(5))-methyltransferase RlmD n=1 Tax=Alicyclobacillus herbarius TaxID=122960 RepID=UPI0023552D8E|nr:23S rRNA (uracil(1939)-C(5))-methyltransferase RlmD [Alicyclobacillus herbarius]MCL6633515.1 23S rRNA (uracil(1939)-C(5))-methyltransferase RlmD [Alicyclobacillus herbarius]
MTEPQAVGPTPSGRRVDDARYLQDSVGVSRYKEAPLPGQVHEVEALRLNDDGEAVAYVNGVAVFITGLLPKERARVRIVERNRRYARAVLVDTPAPTASPADSAATAGEPLSGRIQPLCAVFGDCGGCQLQHLDYQRQLEHKRRMIREALARFAGLDNVTVHPTLGMETPWRYRNQVQVPVEFDGRGGVHLGFYAAKSHQLVPTTACHLEPEPLERTIEQAAHMAAELLGLQANLIHHIIGRYSFTSGEMMLIFSYSADRENSRERHALNRQALADVASRLLQLPGVVCVAATRTMGRHGRVFGRHTDILAGKPYLIERIGGLEFLISPQSFFQVNTQQARRLYDQVLHLAQVGAGDTVLDAYCGTGTMALLLAGQVARVYGIESAPQAIADARENARHNRIRNAEFTVGRVEQVLPAWVMKGWRADVIVLDPPRRGCDTAVLEAVAAVRPRRLVYVSCNHITLARDLRRLDDLGYAVSEVQPVDMFPQTAHVECCSVLVPSVV